MKLTRKNSLQAKSCSLVAVSFALTAMAVSNAAADDVKVFNKRVSGVPAANHEVITDNVLSPEFAPGLIVEGLDRESGGTNYAIRQPKRWQSH
jgi:hypothetical protein